MRLAVALTMLAWAAACDGPVDDLKRDAMKAATDAIFEDLECQKLARPSTLARLRALLENPSADAASALLFAPEHVATLVSMAGPEAEVAVVVVRNTLAVAEHAGFLAEEGWDGLACADPTTLLCTVGEMSISVVCDDAGAAGIEIALARCALHGSVLDGALSLWREGEDTQAVFSALSVDETKVIDGTVTLAIGHGADGLGAAVRTVDGLRYIEHGGPAGGLSCGSQLRVETLATTANDDGALVVQLSGAHETAARSVGVQTFRRHLSYDGACACPLPGSAVAFDVPSPLGDEGTVRVSVTYVDADDEERCATARVELEGWPTTCSGLETVDPDCAADATASTLSQVLTAFCVR
jgi:hypothetical protein